MKNEVEIIVSDDMVLYVCGINAMAIPMEPQRPIIFIMFIDITIFLLLSHILSEFGFHLCVT